MLTPKQITEIRRHLESAQNPLFFFDNDADGLCSFLILQRFIGRGRGVAVRGATRMGKDYFKKIEELKPDYVFILDKPYKPGFDEEFLELVEKTSLPVVWIDHHDVPAPKLKYYYNTFHESGKNEPVSYLCYWITGRKEDMWLSAAGCISDTFLPDFIGELKQDYPELVDTDSKNVLDIRFKSLLGRIVDILNFGLLDSTTNVVSMMKFLMKARSPHDALEENAKTESFLKRYEFIKKIIDRQIERAGKKLDKKRKLLFFTYGGDMSLSQHISDRLIYLYPDYVIVAGLSKGAQIKFSLRGKIDIRQLTLKAIECIEGASGGGHKHATGAQMPADDAPKFKENLLREIEKSRKG